MRRPDGCCQQLVRDSPPLWRLSADGVSISTRHSGRSFGTRVICEGNAFFALNGPEIVLHVALLVILLGLIQALKRNMPASGQRSAALKRPAAQPLRLALQPARLFR